MATIQGSFEHFDRNNPQVYEMFSYFARQALVAGAVHCSARLVLERVRWESFMLDGETMKVNNNFHPYYARKWMKENRKWGFFHTRELTADRHPLVAFSL